VRRISLLLIAAVVVSTLAAPAASARPSLPPDNARGYWDNARLEGAIPRDQSRQSPQAKPPKPGGGVGNSAGAYWTGPELVRRTTGKVFFTAGGVNYVCSGSTVQDGNANVSVVLTAGHCVEDGAGGGFVTNWVYVPDYERWPAKSCATDPGRCFTAGRLVTSAAWANSENFDYDVAFAVIAGNALEATWGSQAIAFNRPTGQMMYSFGYPAAGKFNGTRLVYCNAAVTDDRFSFDQGMRCDMTGGSSGGPWYLDFDAQTGVGTANSLNSFKYSNSNKTMYGPYFGNYAQAIYASAVTGTGGGNTAVAAPASLP
jgi:hypothetical protein